MAGVRLHLYDGNPPPWDRISGLIDASDVTYLAANSAIESMRISEGLALPRQVDEKGNSLLAFTKAVRHLCSQPTLGRTFERILLRRAVEQVATGAELERLKRDSKEWVEALARMRAGGLDLNAPELDASAVTPGVAQVIRDIDRAYEEIIAENVDAVGMEAAIRAWIDTRPRLGDALVMEGFTFLTALQQHLIDTAATYMDVHLVVPYRAEQPRLFEQVRSTYDAWWGEARALNTLVRATPALQEAQNALFTSSTSTDSPLTLVQHAHVHDEVRSVVSRIRECLETGVDASEIVLVTPRRGEYATVLQEEAALQELPVTLGLPPRLLLLTPVGRFILNLYSVFDAGDLNLTPEHFEEMLSSGWLGAIAQHSVHEFRAVKNQLFALCRTYDEWMHVINTLEVDTRRGSGPSRFAADWVEERELEVWRDSVVRIADLAADLFQPGERSIGQHVETLLETLGELPDAQMLAEERTIIQRVKEALATSSESGGLAIRADEFGDILTSLATEYEEASTTEDEALARGDQVWVTTPEGVDGVRRPYVFFIGVGADKVPRRAPESWPLAASSAAEHARLERYMFGAVVRAATTAVHLTYAQRVLDDVTLPSPLAHLAGIVVEEMPEGPVNTPPLPPTTPPPARAVRQEYSLTELAHFGLCPYRYKLERLHPQSRRYTSPIHIPHLAQGRWIDATLRLLEVQANRYAANEVTEALVDAAAEVEDSVREQFPGMAALDWRAARSRVRRELRDMGSFLAQGGNYRISFEAAPVQRRVLERNKRVQFVVVEARHLAIKGIIRWERLNDLVHEEWLRPTPEAATGLTLSVDGLMLFESQAAAFTWWRETIRNAYGAAVTGARDDVRESYQTALASADAQMSQIIEQIEAGHHPRRPGDHCMSCPVRDDCLGLNP